jgi:hypothetical protein
MRWPLKWVGLGVLLLLLVLGLSRFTSPAVPSVGQALQRIGEATGLSSGPGLAWRLSFEPEVTHPVAKPQSPDPEWWVRQIYAQLGQGERAQALATAAALAGQFPNFQLGQLLYADLLNISSPTPVDWQSADPANAAFLLKRLDELLLESKRRLDRNPVQSLKGKIPSALVFLSPQQTYLAAVDASQSRLYWFENRQDAEGKATLHLVSESYISVGMHGMGKQVEGDGKTPVGVYFIQRGLPGEGLPDLFGAGALTLNYPNAVDLMRQKTGSGIWLHGTPSAQYARAPESTDGCVVLPNPEMSRLLQLPNLRMTPVIIAEKLDWVPAKQGQQTFETFQSTLDQWLAARNGHQPEALKIHYSQNYAREGLNLEQAWPRLAQTTLGYRQSAPLELVSALQWQDQNTFMVVTLKLPPQTAAAGASHLRLYWQKEGAHWRIIFQGPA